MERLIEFPKLQAVDGCLYSPSGDVTKHSCSLMELHPQQPFSSYQSSLERNKTKELSECITDYDCLNRLYTANQPKLDEEVMYECVCMI